MPQNTLQAQSSLTFSSQKTLINLVCQLSGLRSCTGFLFFFLIFFLRFLSQGVCACWTQREEGRGELTP